MKEIILNRVAKTSPNYKKYVALVDDEDFEKVNKHNWCIKPDKGNMYAMCRIEGKAICMHQFITGYKMTDHKNGYGLDNQRHNLREVSNQQNCMNGKPRKGISKYKGVCWSKSTKKWQSNITVSGKQIFLGVYENEKDAALAYNVAAQKHYSSFARLNNI